MKRKIEFTITTEHKETRGVEFPIYFERSEPGGDEQYIKINEDLSYISIDIYRGNTVIDYNLKFGKNYPFSNFDFDKSDPDYFLGLSHNSCIQKEFEEMLGALKNRLSLIEPQSIVPDVNR